MDIDNTQTGTLLSSENRFDTYDPQLDVENYKYPNLDLLENYSDSITIEAISKSDKKSFWSWLFK